MSTERDALDAATALAVARIMMTADGECVECAVDLLSQMGERFPQSKEALDRAWTEAGHTSMSWDRDDR